MTRNKQREGERAAEERRAREEGDRVVRLDPPAQPPDPPPRSKTISQAAREWLTDIAKPR